METLLTMKKLDEITEYMLNKIKKSGGTKKMPVGAVTR
jgi:hypothetical protein